MQKIFYKKTLVGIKIISLLKKTVPVTDDKEPIQVLTLKHPKGTYLVAHTHTERKRVANRTQECLIVKKGKIKIDLYGPDKKFFKYVYLKEGQMFLLLHGGYGIHMKEDSELFEVKNGPYIEDKEVI